MTGVTKQATVSNIADDYGTQLPKPPLGANLQDGRSTDLQELNLDFVKKLSSQILVYPSVGADVQAVRFMSLSFATCPKTITEIIRFQFLRCENYATAPEINSARGPTRRYGNHSNPP